MIGVTGRVWLRSFALLLGSGFSLPAVLHGQAAAGTTAALENRSKGLAKAPVTVYEMLTSSVPTVVNSRWRLSLSSIGPTSPPGKCTGSSSISPSPASMRMRLLRPRSRSAPQTRRRSGGCMTCCSASGAVGRPQEPGPFFLSLADSARLSRPAMLACLQSPETTNTVSADAEGAARRRPQHAHLLHRGRPARGRPAGGGVSAGAGLGVRGEDGRKAGRYCGCKAVVASLESLCQPTAKNTSYSAWVHAVIPKPRVTYKPLKEKSGNHAKVKESRRSGSPYGPM